MKIENNSKVVFDYTIKGADGAILGSSSSDEPATYIHGFGLLLPKLEKTLVGKKAGESFELHIPKSEAYGEHIEDLVFEVDKGIFNYEETLEVGMEFQDEYSGNFVRIAEVRGDKVLVDANHPFAGKDLFFDVCIKNVEKASDAEIKEIQKMLMQQHSCGCGCSCDDGSCGDDDCNCESYCDDNDCSCGSGCCR